MVRPEGFEPSTHGLKGPQDDAPQPQCLQGFAGDALTHEMQRGQRDVRDESFEESRDELSEASQNEAEQGLRDDSSEVAHDDLREESRDDVEEVQESEGVSESHGIQHESRPCNEAREQTSGDCVDDRGSLDQRETQHEHRSETLCEHQREVLPELHRATPRANHSERQEVTARDRHYETSGNGQRERQAETQHDHLRERIAVTHDDLPRGGQHAHPLQDRSVPKEATISPPDRSNSRIDPSLLEVAYLWPTLPDAVKQGILAMARATAG